MKRRAAAAQVRKELKALLFNPVFLDGPAGHVVTLCGCECFSRLCARLIGSLLGSFAFVVQSRSRSCSTLHSATIWSSPKSASLPLWRCCHAAALSMFVFIRLSCSSKGRVTCGSFLDWLHVSADSLFNRTLFKLMCSKRFRSTIAVDSPYRGDRRGCCGLCRHAYVERRDGQRPRLHCCHCDVVLLLTRGSVPLLVH